MRLFALALLLAGCDPSVPPRVYQQDFAGNLGPTAPDMARDLGAPPDARYFVDLAMVDG